MMQALIQELEQAIGMAMRQEIKQELRIATDPRKKKWLTGRPTDLETLLRTHPQVTPKGEIQYLVAGGWAVELLTGVERHHHDLDVINLVGIPFSYRLDEQKPEQYFETLSLQPEEYLDHMTAVDWTRKTFVSTIPRKKAKKTHHVYVPVPEFLFLSKIAGFLRAPRDKDYVDLESLANIITDEQLAEKRFTDLLGHMPGMNPAFPANDILLRDLGAEGEDARKKAAQHLIAIVQDFKTGKTKEAKLQAERFHAMLNDVYEEGLKHTLSGSEHGISEEKLIEALRIKKITGFWKYTNGSLDLRIFDAEENRDELKTLSVWQQAEDRSKKRFAAVSKIAIEASALYQGTHKQSKKTTIIAADGTVLGSHDTIETNLFVFGRDKDKTTVYLHNGAVVEKMNKGATVEDVFYKLIKDQRDDIIAHTLDREVTHSNQHSRRHTFNKAYMRNLEECIKTQDAESIAMIRTKHGARIESEAWYFDRAVTEHIQTVAERLRTRIALTGRDEKTYVTKELETILVAAKAPFVSDRARKDTTPKLGELYTMLLENALFDAADSMRKSGVLTETAEAAQKAYRTAVYNNAFGTARKIIAQGFIETQIALQQNDAVLASEQERLRETRLATYEYLEKRIEEIRSIGCSETAFQQTVRTLYEHAVFNGSLQGKQPNTAFFMRNGFAEETLHTWDAQLVHQGIADGQITLEEKSKLNWEEERKRKNQAESKLYGIAQYAIEQKVQVNATDCFTLFKYMNPQERGALLVHQDAKTVEKVFVRDPIAISLEDALQLPLPVNETTKEAVADLIENIYVRWGRRTPETVNRAIAWAQTFGVTKEEIADRWKARIERYVREGNIVSAQAQTERILSVGLATEQELESTYQRGLARVIKEKRWGVAANIARNLLGDEDAANHSG